MTKYVEFTKMHGAGNDYIYVDIRRHALKEPEKLAVCWSDRHKGIGSDGLVLIGDSKVADFSMRIFNADGSEAMMCGNASRCIGKYVYEKGLTSKTVVTLETLSGIKTIHLHIKKERVDTVTVDMGIPQLMPVDFSELGPQIMREEALGISGCPLRGTAISMGNPHLVIFCEVNKINLEALGPQCEHLSYFPQGVNTEFAEVIGKDRIRMRVWERGSGITQACGTGACAAAAAAFLTGRTSSTVEMVMDGGTLTLHWDETSGHMLMTGDANIVFEGKIEVP